MSAKPKIRFSALVDGREIELFSIRDRKAKGAVLIPAPIRFFEFGKEGLREIVEQHYSVHRNESPDITITQKTLLSDGTQLSNVAYIHDADDHMLWPIFARRVPQFADETNCLLAANSRDSVVRIGEYKTSEANLLYSVFVTHPSLDFEQIPVKGARIFYARYDHFQILVLATYLNVPSLHEGDACGWATSPEAINGAFSEGHFQLHVKPIPSDLLLQAHWTLMGQLRQKLLFRLSDLFEGEPEMLPQITPLLSAFSLAPLFIA